MAPTDEPPPTEEAIRKRSQELVAINNPIALAAYNRSRRALATTNAQMAAVRVPTLGVIGSAEAFLAGMKEIQGILPALKVVVIEGATRSTRTARGAPTPPEFANAIREFIAAHRDVVQIRPWPAAQAAGGYGMKQVYLSDPDGHEICLQCPVKRADPAC